MSKVMTEAEERADRSMWRSHFTYPAGTFVSHDGYGYKLLCKKMTTDRRPPPDDPEMYERTSKHAEVVVVETDNKTPQWNGHAAYSKDSVVVFEGHEFVCVQPVPMIWDSNEKPNIPPLRSRSWRFKDSGDVRGTPNYSAHDVGDDKDTIQMELPDRHRQHGDWVENSSIHGELMRLCVANLNNSAQVRADAKPSELHSATTALVMISAKIARILTGDFNDPDHWLDIAGYARLHYGLLMKGKDNDKQ